MSDYEYTEFPVEDTTATADTGYTDPGYTDPGYTDPGTATFDQTTADGYYTDYQDSTAVEWDAWRASVDAYVEGDTVASYDWQQLSIAAGDAADQSWDAWNAEYQLPVDTGTDTSWSSDASWSATDTSTDTTAVADTGADPSADYYDTGG